MKTPIKTIFVGIMSFAMANAASANQNNANASQYVIKLIKDCDVVQQLQMNEEQIQAYQTLQREEDIMDDLEKPIDAIEDKIDSYSDQMEAFAELAIQEDGDSLHINKQYLKQQKLLAKKIEALVDAHQKDFDAIGNQGTRIHEAANVFRDSVKDSFNEFDYDHVQIQSPNNVSNAYHCSRNSFDI